MCAQRHEAFDHLEFCGFDDDDDDDDDDDGRRRQRRWTISTTSTLPTTTTMTTRQVWSLALKFSCIVCLSVGHIRMLMFLSQPSQIVGILNFNGSSQLPGSPKKPRRFSFWVAESSLLSLPAGSPRCVSTWVLNPSAVSWRKDALLPFSMLL